MASVVHELRRTRRTHRLGELEWFDVAYRAYLAALAGGFAILWLSGLVSDEAATPAELVDVTDHGPAIVGLVVVAAIALGVRSGSDGGPVALEAPDVRHLLLAPIPRRAVLLAPALQRLRTMAGGGALVGAIAGQLAARRLPGSGVAWAVSGALAGAAIGALSFAAAVLAHVIRLPGPGATAIGAFVLAAQGGAVAGWWPGPGDGIGSLARWGMRQRPVDLVSLAVVVALASVAVALAGRLRPEPLVRRADLVSQLRFAVTMQDLRTVVLIRRQLRDEQPRHRPWPIPIGRRASTTGRTVWRRGWRGFARYPTARLGRLAMLAALAGVGAGLAARGTTPAVALMAVALYLLGLDAIEPLSQEIDHPDHTDAVPLERGWLLLHHLAVPAVAVVPLAIVGAGATIAVEPASWPAALALAIPVVWLGLGGAVVSVVRDAPDLAAQPASSTAVPPEFAGFTSSIRLLYPLVISALATLPVLAVREVPTVGAVVRSLAGLALVLAALMWWVRRRDHWRRRWQAFIQGNRTTT
ncbi:MAG: hypothetical protein ACR2HQ_04095 [Ilumatobacteraceae bacterium]